jgi:hypothetical protein
MSVTGFTLDKESLDQLIPLIQEGEEAVYRYSLSEGSYFEVKSQVNDEFHLTSRWTCTESAQEFLFRHRQAVEALNP